MKTLAVLLAIELAIAPFCHAQKLRNAHLAAQLEKAVSDFRGTAGVYVYCPDRKIEAGVNADSIFPTASMIKVPILCTLWQEIGEGKLDPDSVIRFYPDSVGYRWKGEDALARFAPGEEIQVRQLMTHMITFSDNHASLYLQRLAGGGEAVNRWLQLHGFYYLRVNSRTPGREIAYTHYGWGQTTPREMAALLLKIRRGEVVNPLVSEAIYRHLTRIYWTGEALSQIPPGIQAASKQGAVDESRSEVILVNAPHGDYVFCVITKNQFDTGWDDHNEGFALIRNISRILWHFFEPDIPYEQPPGMEHYHP